MKAFRILYSAIFLLCLAGLAACLKSGKQIVGVDPAFGRYISGYTSGMISRKATIRIQLADTFTASGSPLLASSRENPQDLIEFEPDLKGKARWLEEGRTLEFTPEKDLLAGQLYTVNLKLGKLRKVEAGFENFHFQFATVKPSLRVSLTGLSPCNNHNGEWQKLEGTVYADDATDSLVVVNCLQATQNGKALKVHFRESDFSSYSNSSEFHFTADSILRRLSPGQVFVNWKNPQSGSRENRDTIAVPALGDFSVSEVKLSQEPDQSLRIEFSDPLLPRQDLNGIVRIDGIDNLSFTIEGNTISVFMPIRYVGTKTLSISTGLKNFKGYRMLKTYTGYLDFEEPKPRVRLIGSGNILPNSNGLIFPFEAIGLKAVDVRILRIYENNVQQFLQVNGLDGNNELHRVARKLIEAKIDLDKDKKTDTRQWSRYSFDLSKFIKPEPGAIYRVDIKFSRNYATCSCPPQETDKNSEEAEGQDGWNSESDRGEYDFDGGYTHYDSDYYDRTDGPCSNSYYYGKAVGRNILASDLGLLVKMGEDKLAHVFISNLLSTLPVPDCRVEFYDYTRQLIATASTNGIGMAEVSLKRKPFLLIARYGKQRGYLKLRDEESNTLSKFDVSGEVVQKGVKGFIYGERGVWRPGDSLFLNFMMEDKEHLIPANHPVIFELVDPADRVAKKISSVRSLHGLYDFRTSTDPEAPTGNWMARVHVGNRVFTQKLKIETVKPNRLKIYLAFGADKLSRRSKDSTAELQVKWLHGAIAKNLRAKIDVTVNQVTTEFKGYKEYCFDDPLRAVYTDQQTVFEGKTDEKGKATFHTSLRIGDAAPGMLRAFFSTKVFEEGGDFSIDRFSIPYSPYTSYVGLRVPKGNAYGGMLEAGKEHLMQVATVSSDGLPVSRSNIQLRIYQVGWRWWWDRYEDNMSAYLARTSTVPLVDSVIRTVNGNGAFKFNQYGTGYGRFLVLLTDPVSGHSTGQMVYVDYPWWSHRNAKENENASMLNFSADKEKYAPGESVKIAIPSPAEGYALVAVESGSRVLKKFWVPTHKGETHVEFTATADMAPNCYIHTTLIQPHSKTVNDLPIRLYGIVPIQVDDPASHIQPVITMAEVVRPESVASVHIKENKGRPMTYTLALVDEGLLDLTRFKTPDPWKCFHAKEALGVKTWDLYDMVLGAYSGKLDKMLSIGGDGDGSGKKAMKANRFKPVVSFMGPFHLAAGAEASHKIKIPSYVGSVRVMVVAGEAGAYGQAEKTVAVRKPLMVLATLPRVLGPGETVSIPVNVFAMEKQIKEVEVEIEAGSMLIAQGSCKKHLSFKEIGDEVLNFEFKTAEKTGIAKVRILASCGSERTVQEIELDVRTPNPLVAEASEIILEPGKSYSLPLAFKGMEGTNKALLEVSAIPSINLGGRLSYLLEYPHGCIEQTTSAVFPQMLAGDLMELKQAEKDQISAHVKAGLKRLQLFQTASGGFSYWPSESEASEWGSSYAGHFMLEAEKLGYDLPAGMKQRWIRYQQNTARNWSLSAETRWSSTNGDNSYMLDQAYRLYTLALASAPELGAMNRMREEKALGNAARWRLAAAYQLVGQAEIAKELLSGATMQISRYTELSYCYGSDKRDKAMILETLCLLNQRAKGAGLAKELAAALNSPGWMNTQETAYCLLAICRFAGAEKNSHNVYFSYALGTETPALASSASLVYQQKFSEKELNHKESLKVKNEGKCMLYVKWIMQGIPLLGDPGTSASHMNMEVRFTNLKGETIQPDKLLQGTDFVAEVKLSNPGTNGILKEMTLNQIFPSGWEIHNSRMDDNVSSLGSAPSRYQDIRDDRVYTYYDLNVGETKTYRVLLNATYLGRFYMPAVYTEAMYDNSIHARAAGRWVEVVKELPVVVKK
jgi:uncharacterized protein YfaS (alpha-2-macroglobulin family)